MKVPYPVFSKHDRRALLIIQGVILVVLVSLGLGVYIGHRTTSPSDAERPKESWMQRMESALSPGNDVANVRRPATTYACPEEQIETFDFDPNTADSTTLLRLGLAPYQVRSIYRYRARHGRYHCAEDFRHVPGMTEEVYQRLAPHIRIAPQFQYIDAHAESATYPHTERDTLRQTAKYAPGTTVDINRADTAQLRRVPQIGIWRARRIIERRDSLGGYVSLDQVMEIGGIPEEVLTWFTVTPGMIKPMKINALGVSQLMRHPYIHYDQALSIVRLRRQGGPIHSWSEIRILDTFSDEDIRRLTPYVTFDE